MRGEDQAVSLFDIPAKLSDDGIGMPGARHDGVAVMPEHMRVHRVDLRYLNVKRLMRRVNDKFYAADSDLALADNVCHLMHRVIKRRAECGSEICDERLAAAVCGIFHGIFGSVLRHIGQKGRPGAVVGDKYALDRHILQICGQLGNIVMEAGRFDNNSLAVFFNDEDLIVNKIVGFVCVQLYRAEIVNADLALCELYLIECVLVHDMISCFISDFLLRGGSVPLLARTVYNRFFGL